MARPPPGHVSKPGCTILVGGLGSSVRKTDLQGAFGEFGRVIRLDLDGTKAYLEYDDSRDAKDAVDCMNGKRVRDCILQVEVKYKQETPTARQYRQGLEALQEKNGRGGGGGGGGERRHERSDDGGRRGPERERERRDRDRDRGRERSRDRSRECGKDRSRDRGGRRDTSRDRESRNPRGDTRERSGHSRDRSAGSGKSSASGRSSGRHGDKRKEPLAVLGRASAGRDATKAKTAPELRANAPRKGVKVAAAASSDSDSGA